MQECDWECHVGLNVVGQEKTDQFPATSVWSMVSCLNLTHELLLKPGLPNIFHKKALYSQTLEDVSFKSKKLEPKILLWTLMSSQLSGCSTGYRVGCNKPTSPLPSSQNSSCGVDHPNPLLPYASYDISSMPRCHHSLAMCTLLGLSLNSQKSIDKTPSSPQTTDTLVKGWL